MNLYIFKDFAYDYTGGIAFAIADDEVDARELISKEIDYNGDDWGKLEIHPLNEKIAAGVMGGQ